MLIISGDLMRREEKPTKRHWMLYCTYDTLNMFHGIMHPRCFRPPADNILGALYHKL